MKDFGSDFKNVLRSHGIENVQLDDMYDDLNGNYYDVADYGCDEEDAESTSEKRELTDEDMEIIASVPDAELKSKAEMIKIFTRIAAVINDPDSMQYEIEEAQMEALSYMKGIVKALINTKFAEYVKRDRDFAQDLEQTANLYILNNLGRYDGSRGIAPSTYFFIYIKSGMVAVTNEMKNCVKPGEAALRRKINKVDKEMAAHGRKATMRDYMTEISGETRSKIETTLRSMQYKTGHLDAMEGYAAYIPGDETCSMDFENPETASVRKMCGEDIVKRLYKICAPEDIELFMMNKIQGMDVTVIAEKLGRVGEEDKLRRIIKDVTSSASFDPYIRRIASGFGYGHDYNDSGSIINIFDTHSQDENIEALAPAGGFRIAK